MEYVTLNNGVKMPMLGFGVYQIKKEECKQKVIEAIEALTGAYKSNKEFAKDGSDFRANMPQYTDEGIKKTNELLEVVNKIAEKYNATPAQISLAWMINKHEFIVPIPGLRKVERLQQNFDSGKITLTAEEIKILDDKLNSMEFDVFGGHEGK